MFLNYKEAFNSFMFVGVYGSFRKNCGVEVEAGFNL
jgi:hypothetical protein